MRIAGCALALAVASLSLPAAAHDRRDGYWDAHHHYHYYHHYGRERYYRHDCRRAGNTGTVVGAVGGGILGSSLGGGRLGNTLLGAGAGAVAGHEIGKHSC